MLKIILLICLLNVLNAQAQNSITKSFGGMGIRPTSGSKTITEDGKILVGNSKDLEQRLDTTTKKISLGKTANVSVKPIFLLADSILELQKIVIPNPSSCGGYGLHKTVYNIDNKSILLFCSPNLSAYDNFPLQIKKAKKKAIKQQLTTKLKNAEKLFDMYQRLASLIINAN